MSTTHVLTLTPQDPSQRSEIERRLRADYSDTITMRDCETRVAICLTLSTPFGDTIKKAALENAVHVIEERFHAVGLAGVKVTSRGVQIVVELPAADQAKLTAVSKLIPRTGKLELKAVDDDSPFMKRVFAHVGSGRGGAATDKLALDAGVHAEIDSWQDDAGTRHTDYYLLCSDRRQLEAYFVGLAMVDPSFKVPDDRQLAFELVEPLQTGGKSEWRSYYIERAAGLTGTAISEASVSMDPNMNRPVVLLDLNRYGTQVFADLTARLVGRKLAILLDGTITSAPIINGPIRGGRASITMGGADSAQQQRDAHELVVVLKTGSLPAPLVEASRSVVP